MQCLIDKNYSEVWSLIVTQKVRVSLCILSWKRSDSPVFCVRVWLCETIDGFQMSIQCPNSGGQTCDQEAAVQQTFHLKRSNFFYLSVLVVRT